MHFDGEGTTANDGIALDADPSNPPISYYHVLKGIFPLIYVADRYRGRRGQIFAHCPYSRWSDTDNYFLSDKE